MRKKISFYVVKNRIDKNGFVPIFAQVTINSKNYPFQVEKTKARYWNTAKQKVNKNRGNEPDNRHTEINSLIDRISANPDRFDRFFHYKEPPVREDVRITLFQIQSQGKDFWQAYDEFIESNRERVAYNTTRNRNTAKKFIQKYQKHIGINLQFCDIDLHFFEKLRDYAFKIEKVENNTFAAYVAKFKSFLEWCNEKGYFKDISYRKYSFTEKSKSIVCLTPEEFKTLYNFTFESKKLSNARDLYCFGCLTGLRFSDIASLRYEHFQNGYIVKTIQKTGQEDRIPLLPQASSIIDRHNNGSIYPLPRLSNQKLNNYIKECCELAGIDSPTIECEYRGNKIIEVAYPKFELITAHTARKTFITIGFMMGLDVKIIKSITGHKKEATFDKYLQIADEFKRDKMLKAWKDV